MIVSLHIACATVALLLGPVILLGRKGDRRHRGLGLLFLGTMAGVDLSGFGIYEFTGGPSLFHALALLNAVTLWRGLLAARRRDIANHLTLMAYGYAALFAALGSRLPELLPGWPYELTLALGIGAPLALAGLLAQRAVGRLETQSSASSS